MNNLSQIAINGYISIVRKDIVRIFRIWVQTLVPPIISQGLYFIIFGGIIGSQISNISGVSYMQFILPGIIMMAIITNSFMNTASVLIGAKFMKNLDEVLVSPVPKYVVLIGYVTGGVIRGLINGFMVLLVAFFFIPFQIYNVLLILLIAILASALFSLAGFLNGLFANSFDQVSIIPSFILTPLTYLGGVFYDLNMLPEFWRGVSRLNPIVYIIDSFRFAFFGISTQNVYLSLFILILCTFILYIINLQLLIKGYGIRS
jgi:ABC-2 type transport system permease protein